MEGFKNNSKRESSINREGSTKKILVCIGAPGSHAEDGWRQLQSLSTSNVNYYANEEEWKSLKQKNAGENSYVISSIDSANKDSSKYADCTGIVAIGIDKETGRNISFLSHQDAKRLNPQYGPSYREDMKIKQKFIDDLSSSFTELLSRSKEGTIDVVVFGGWAGDESRNEDYRQSIELIGSTSRSILNIDPFIAVGPNQERTMDTTKVSPEDGHSINDVRVVLDTINRRLYLERPVQIPRPVYVEPERGAFGTGRLPFSGSRHSVKSTTDVAFKASEIDDMERKHWEKAPYDDD